MSKATEFISYYTQLIEAVKERDKIKLGKDIKSDSGLVMPEGSIVLVKAIGSQGGKYIIKLEAIDGEISTITTRNLNKLDVGKVIK